MCSTRILHRAALIGLTGASIACGGDSLSPGGVVASVTISPSTPVMNVGAELPLVATLKDAQGNTLTGPKIFWTSSDTTIATVSDAGIVTAVALGTAQIAASSQGTPGLATVTVAPTPVASVVIVPENATASVGSTVQLQAVTYDAQGNVLTGRTVVWSSDHQSVATVDDAGHVRAVAEGHATIAATSEGQSGTSAITVNAPSPPPISEAAVKTVDVSPSSKTIHVGETVQLHVTLKDADGRTLTGRSVAWTSSDNSDAIVSSTGLVLGISSGDATITATSEGKSGSAKIKVQRRDVHEVTVGLGKSELDVGQSTQATATLYASDGAVLTDRPVTWLSSNGAVASISSSGVVQAVTPGQATITASSDGQDGAANLTVKDGGDQNGGSTGSSDPGGGGKKGKGHGKPHGHG